MTDFDVDTVKPRKDAAELIRRAEEFHRRRGSFETGSWEEMRARYLKREKDRLAYLLWLRGNLEAVTERCRREIAFYSPGANSILVPRWEVPDLVGAPEDFTQLVEDEAEQLAILARRGRGGF